MALSNDRSVILDLHGIRSSNTLQRKQTSLDVSSSAVSTSRSPRANGRKIDFYLSVPDFRLFLKVIEGSRELVNSSEVRQKA